MKIEVISYPHHLAAKEKWRLTAEVIGSSKADLIVFSGHAVTSPRYIEPLRKALAGTHSKATAFFDVRQDGKNHLYAFKDGKIKDLKTEQLFTSSEQLDEKLADVFLTELKRKRIFLLPDGKKVLVMLCGENNIVINRKPNTPEHKIHFRLEDEKLKTEFEKILSSVDIVVNPTHSMNTRPWIYEERAEYFSSEGRIYCYSAEGNSLNSKYLQYVYRNGRQLKRQASKGEYEGVRYCRRVYKIPER